MAAARVWQAAARLASGFASSQPARAVGKTLAAGGATYCAAERAMSETVPYGPDGGRRRGPMLWAAMLGGWPDALDHATAVDLKEIGHTEVLSQVSSASSNLVAVETRAALAARPAQLPSPTTLSLRLAAAAGP